LYPLGPNTFTQSSVLGFDTSVREIIDAIGLAFGTVDTKSSALFNAVMVLLSTTQFQLWCVATENLYMFAMTSSILFHCRCFV